MRKNKNHIINKLFLEINTKSLEKAEEVKNNIHDFTRNILTPQLLKTLNSFPNEEIHRIEKLEINLACNFLNEKTRFEDELQIQFLSLNERGNKPYETETQLSRIIPKSANITQMFLYFVEHGTLPWYGDEGQLAIFQVPKKVAHLFKDPSFSENLKQLILNNDNAFNRLIYQFPAELAIHALLSVKELNAEISKGLNKFLKKADINLRYNGLLVIRNFFLQLDLTSRSNLIEVLKTRENEIIKCFTMANRLSVSRKLIEFRSLQEFLRKSIPNGYVKNFTWQNLPTGNLNEGMEETPAFLNAAQEKIGIHPGSVKNISKEDIEDNLVKQAGLIIIHPFITGFFKKLGFIENSKNILNEKMETAVQVLHYLATGANYFFEANLIFEKFLCNYPIGIPVRRESMLNEEIKSTSNKLLSDVISLWPALKNTSPDGLRQMFFQRDGKLIQKDGNFRLIVERKAQDILLEKLNWSLSLVKIPFRKELLFIDW